jgi:hypothetical protein
MGCDVEGSRASGWINGDLAIVWKEGERMAGKRETGAMNDAVVL